MATRSLGVLSLDLVAKIGGFEQGMDKAEKRTQKWRREVKRNVDAAGKAFAAGASVAAGALAVMSARVINNAQEIENFSKVANTGTEDFQRFAFAAERFGVEQDKLADILKDTTDRVGDFIQTGGGPMADFFENIAPQVGVTAEQFRNLSGADALGLYVDSLEKANLSQSEMTFYMEAIASDATLLLPLLQDNGRELERFGDQAEKAGAVLSRVELDNLLDAKENIDDLHNAITGLQNEVTVNAVPAITEMTDLLSDPKTIEALSDVAEAIITVASAAVTATVEITEFTQGVAESVARLAHGEPEILALERSIDQLQSTLESGVIADGKLLTGVRLATGEFLHQGTAVEALEAKLKSLQRQRQEFFGGGSQTQSSPLGIIPELDNSLITGATAVSDKTAETADNIAAFVDPMETFNNLYESTIEKLTAQEAALGRQRNAQAAYNALVQDLQTDEERLTQQVRDRLAILEDVHGITDAQRNETLGRIADSATADAPELGRGVSSMEGIDTARMELQSWYDEQRDMLQRFREDHADQQATWNAEELALKEEYEKQLTAITNRENDLRTQQQLEGYQVLLDAAGMYFSAMEGEEAAYARAAISIGSALLDQKKQDALEGILADTHGAAMGAYKAMASIPYVGPVLGAAAAGTVYAAGAVAAAGVTGLAHDGIDSVPEDGTWLLQQGERVTTSETSAKLDRTLDNIQRGMDGRGGVGGTTVNQTIAVEGKPDTRTANQIAREAERKQRMARLRLGR